MTEDREILQARAEEAVQTIEAEIRQAREFPDGPPGFMDRIRRGWDRIAYQSTVGSWGLRILSVLIVFAALHVSVQYGVAIYGSLLNDAIGLLPKSVENTAAVLWAVELLLSLSWLASPTLGMPLCAVVLYMCFGGLAPIALLLTFVILLFFQLEDRLVSALLVALPAMTLLTPLKIGLLVVLAASFASTRKHNGTVKSLGLVYFALLELCRGTFGVVSDSRGSQIIPTADGRVKPLARVSHYFNLLEGGTNPDRVFWQIMTLMALFFAVGLVFSRLLNLRYKGTAKPFIRKMQIDLKDGVIFAVLLVLLCLIPSAVTRFTMLTGFDYSYTSILLQVLCAYILTRPLAGKSPDRSDTIVGGEKNYIFISYAHNDIDRIKPYLKILRRKGYEFWYDDNIRTGTEWQGVIASNLASCTCFLAFISKTSITSEYCLKEINYATSKKKPMAVIMLDDVLLPPVLEMHLASLQAVQRGKFSSDMDCMQKVFEMEQLDRCKS